MKKLLPLLDVPRRDTPATRRPLLGSTGRVALPLAAALSLGACKSSMVLLHEEAPSFEAQRYQSFRLNQPSVGEVDAELGRLIREGLIVKGYREADDAADIVVTYKLLVGSAKKPGADVSEVAAASGDVDMLAIGTDGAGESRNKVLLLLVQDAETFDTLWVGWSQANLSARDLQDRARVAISELLSRLPPGRG